MYLFLDTETTGLPRRYNAPAHDIHNWPRLVQVAWLLTDADGHELVARSFIIRPDGFVIPHDAVRVHGISTEVAGRLGVDIRLVLDALEGDLSRASLLVAHNADFDAGVVGAEFYRAKRKTNPLDGLRRYCTMRESTALCRIPGGPRGWRTRRPALRGWKWPTLEQLHYALFRVWPESSHDALADVRTCARCFFQLVGSAVSMGEEDTLALEDELEIQSLFDDIYAYAEECEGFDATYVDDVYAQFEERGWITAAQREALERIRDMLADRVG